MHNTAPFKLTTSPALLQTLNIHPPLNKTENDIRSWIIYGENRLVDKIQVLVHQHQLMLMNAWMMGPYQVIRISGNLTKKLRDEVEEAGLDCADVSHIPTLQQPGLIVLDMDSTSIQIECIDQIAALAGVGDEVAQVTERAMRGELDFEHSLRARVGKLANADVSILAQVRNSLPLMPELKEMVKTLEVYNWKVAIASGGFTYFSDYLQEKLGLVYAKSNVLGIENGKLTGQVIGPVVDAQEKAKVLLSLAQELDMNANNTLAVGDGANDLPMIHAAHFGVAYHAKPKVIEQAPAAIVNAYLGGVLCILSASLI